MSGERAGRRRRCVRVLPPRPSAPSAPSAAVAAPPVPTVLPSCSQAALGGGRERSTRREEGAARAEIDLPIPASVLADGPHGRAPCFPTHTLTRFQSTHSHPPQHKMAGTRPRHPVGRRHRSPRPPPRATGGAAPTTTARGGGGELVGLPCWTPRLEAEGWTAHPRRVRLARRAGAAARPSETAPSPVAAEARPRGGA